MAQTVLFQLGQLDFSFLVLAGFNNQPEQLHKRDRYKEDLKQQVSPGPPVQANELQCLTSNTAEPFLSKDRGKQAEQGRGERTTEDRGGRRGEEGGGAKDPHEAGI